MSAERERFEEWATTEASPVLEIGRWELDDFPNPGKHLGDYREPSTQGAWEVWRAASEATWREASLMCAQSGLTCTATAFAFMAKEVGGA